MFYNTFSINWFYHLIKSAIPSTALIALISSLSLMAQANTYQCDSADTSCVPNFNRHAANKLGHKRIDAVRVLMKGRSTTSKSSIRNKIRKLNTFFQNSSRGLLSIEIAEFRTVTVSGGSCSKAKQQAHRGNRSSVFFTVYVMPKGLCGSSNAGSKKMNLNDNLFRSYAHEAGHLLGLAHSNRIDTDTGETIYYGGYSSIMGRAPAPNYTVNQLHWLGWTDIDDVVRIDPAQLKNGGTIEVDIRPLDDNSIDDNVIPIAYVWDLSDEKRLFISMPKSVRSRGNRIKGGEIFFHLANTKQGCKGICMNSTLVKRILDPSDFNRHEIEGLTITPVDAVYDEVRVKLDRGWSTERRYSKVTLRIALTDSDEGLSPDGSDEPVISDDIVFGVDHNNETIFNENHGSIDYQGRWRRSTNRGAKDHQRDVRYTYRNGASFSFTFTGSAISLYMPQTPRQGDIEVILDGTNHGRVDVTGNRYRPQFRAFHAGNLAPGKHKITVIKRSGRYMQLDAIGVVP